MTEEQTVSEERKLRRALREVLSTALWTDEMLPDQQRLDAYADAITKIEEICIEALGLK